MPSLCRLPVAKNNFGQILTFGGGAPVPTPFYRRGPNLVCYSRPKVYTYLQNFIWMCSLSRFPITIILGEILTFLGAPVQTPFYRWEANLVCYSRPKVYTYVQNFIWMCSLSWLPVAKNHNFWQIFTFWGAPVPALFYRWERNLVCYSRPMIYAYVLNFVSITLFCRRLAAKTPIFAVFWTSAFSGVAIWRQSEKVQHGCTTTNVIKIVSVLQRLHGEIGRTISDVQKRDGQTDKHTKNWMFLATTAAGEIGAPPNLAWW